MIRLREDHLRVSKARIIREFRMKQAAARRRRKKERAGRIHEKRIMNLDHVAPPLPRRVEGTRTNISQRPISAFFKIRAVEAPLSDFPRPKAPNVGSQLLFS